MELRNHKTIGIISALLILAICVAAVAKIELANRAKEEPLAGYWASDSVAAERLRNFVEKATDPSDKENFIPEKARSPARRSTPITTR